MISYFIWVFLSPFPQALAYVFFATNSAVSQFNPEPGEEIKCFLAHERNVAESVNKCGSFSSLWSS